MQKFAKRIRSFFFVLPCAVLFGLFAAPQAAHAQTAPITEVTMEHTSFFGNSPAYKVILRSNGAATLISLAYTDKHGTYAAYFSGFSRLARAIQARNFAQFKPFYSIGITDQPHVITTIVQQGRRKTVDDDADSGPQALWEVETLIDGVVAEAQWKKVSKSIRPH